MNRVKSREYLLQLAYQMEITSETALETLSNNAPAFDCVGTQANSNKTVSKIVNFFFIVE